MTLMVQMAAVPTVIRSRLRSATDEPPNFITTVSTDDGVIGAV